MFYKSRDIQWSKYNEAREFFIGRNDILVKLEEYLAKTDLLPKVESRGSRVLRVA